MTFTEVSSAYICRENINKFMINRQFESANDIYKSLTLPFLQL